MTRRTRPEHPRRSAPLLAAVAIALLLLPAAAWAGHQFTDVQTGDTFHEDIEWLRDRGVTRGCNPPDNTRYCPDATVTREQMAAFLHRLETEEVFLTADALEGLLPIATFLFGPDLTIASQDHRAPVTGPVSVEDNGVGGYLVTLPGYAYGLATSRATCTYMGNGAGGTVTVASLSGRMWIRVWDANGDPAEVDNSAVTCAVYG